MIVGTWRERLQERNFARRALVELAYKREARHGKRRALGEREALKDDAIPRDDENRAPRQSFPCRSLAQRPHWEPTMTSSKREGVAMGTICSNSIWMKRTVTVSNKSHSPLDALERSKSLCRAVINT